MELGALKSYNIISKDDIINAIKADNADVTVSTKVHNVLNNGYCNYDPRVVMMISEFHSIDARHNKEVYYHRQYTLPLTGDYECNISEEI